jgi:hypothetical protein
MIDGFRVVIDQRLHTITSSSQKRPRPYAIRARPQTISFGPLGISGGIGPKKRDRPISILCASCSITCSKFGHCVIVLRKQVRWWFSYNTRSFQNKRDGNLNSCKKPREKSDSVSNQSQLTVFAKPTKRAQASTALKLLGLRPQNQVPLICSIAAMANCQKELSNCQKVHRRNQNLRNKYTAHVVRNGGGNFPPLGNNCSNF